MKCFTRSEAETMALAARLAPMLSPGDTVLLEGDLGAGKSVLARGIARGLGVEGPMPSPTFTLMNTYHGRLTVHHFDLYRISDEDSLYNIGYFDVAGQPDAVTLIEWSENVAAFLPPFDYVIEIRIGADGSREFCFRREEC